jgi:hypothetical protein
MRIITHQLLGNLVWLVLMASCSRPVAYVQPGLREPIEAATPRVSSNNTPAFMASPDQQIASVTHSLNELDALVSTDNKLTSRKTSQQRQHNRQALLVAPSEKISAGTTEVVSTRKMTFVERLMVKKLNTRIRRQLAPNNPEKTWASKSILAIGAVLLLGGILLLAFASGGGFALGAIAVAAGLVLLLVELL